MYTIICLDPATMKTLFWHDIPRTHADALARIILDEIKPGYLCIVRQQPCQPAPAGSRGGS